MKKTKTTSTRRRRSSRERGGAARRPYRAKSARARFVPARPLDKLLDYQDDWVRDTARFKFGLFARQTGKDFSAAAEGIYDIYLKARRGEKTTWLIAAPSERQSLESLAKWRQWAEAFKFAVADSLEERENPRNSESRLKSATMIFAGGSRVIAVPGQPDTVRGFSANVVLTEFAFFEQPDLTWRAILPSITNPLQGGVKKCRLITTPNGLGNKAHQLWTANYHESVDVNCRESVARDGRKRVANENATTGGCGLPRTDDRQVVPTGRAALPGTDDRQVVPTGRAALPRTDDRQVVPTGRAALPRGSWSCHKVTIYDAVARGLEIDIEELREALNDPEGWAQEYELQFLDQSSVLLPYDLIAACENPLATATADPAYWLTSGGAPLVLGIDFGRKRDLTVSWAIEVQGGSFKMTKEVLELERVSTPEQVELLRPRIRKARKACLDYTGPGVGLGDYLVKEFGEWNPDQHKFGKIELCTFTNALKVDIFPKLRMEFERRLVGVPVARAIREDLHTISRVALAGGGVTYKAPHSADGHADRCTALALAMRAAMSASSQPAQCGRVPSAYNRIAGRVLGFGVGRYRGETPI